MPITKENNQNEALSELNISGTAIHEKRTCPGKFVKTKDFTQLEEKIITQVITDHLIDDLRQQKIAIEYYNGSCQMFREMYSQLYREKKDLIYKYTNNRDLQVNDTYFSFEF